MRFYELLITEPDGSNNLVEISSVPKGLSLFRTYAPLNIEFQVNVYENNLAQSAGYIRIYNIDVNFFVMSRTLIGKRILFRAGWKESVFTQKMGWKSVTDDVLIDMEISNTLADFSGTNPYVDMFFIPYTKSRKVSTGDEAEQAEQVPQFKTEISKGEKVFDKIQETLSNILGDSVKVVGLGTKILSLIAKSPQTTIISGGVLTDYVRAISMNFDGVRTMLNPQTNELYLYQDDYTENISEKISKTNAIKLAHNELISQPTLVDVVGQLTIETRLRTDLNTGKWVYLYGNVPTTNSLSSISSGIVSSNVDTRRIFQDGYYIVNAVTHKGNFYGTSASDWSSTLTLSPYSAKSLKV